MLLWMTLALAGDMVFLDRATLQDLIPPAPPSVDLPVAWVSDRAVRVRVAGATWQVESSWTLQSPAPRWFSGVLAGPELAVSEVRLDGQLASSVSNVTGTSIHVWVSGEHLITVKGTIPAPPAGAPARLELLPGARGRVDLAGGERVISTETGPAPSHGGAFWTSAARLDIVPRPATASAASALIVARAAIGLTLGDGEASVRGVVRWQALRGSMQTLTLRGDNLGDDARLTAPPGASVERTADGWTITLPAPATAPVDVQVAGTIRLSAADQSTLALPRLLPSDTFRVERVVQIARDSDLEVVPVLTGGHAIAASALPSWARGLTRGQPLVARTGEAAGRVDLLRYVPVEQPACMVDVADWTAVITAEGRLLAQGTLTVRNERAASLTLTLDEGQELLAVVVDGETVGVAPDEGRRVHVPLPRSVETVDGLLAFPVELAVLDRRGPTWARGIIPLTLPAPDAAVAVRHVTVHLPPDWRVMQADGSVDAFTEGEGLAYGFGSGIESAQLSARYREAVDRWMVNDFSGAQAALDDIRDQGGDNANVQRLQSNLDLVLVPSTSDSAPEGVESAAARRVRDMARARAADEERHQSEILREAEKAEEAGDYAGAAEAYGEALTIADKLSRLEQREQSDQRLLSEDLDKRASVARKNVAATREMEESEPELGEERDFAYKTDDAQDFVVDGAEEPDEPVTLDLRLLGEGERPLGGLGMKGTGMGGGAVGGAPAASMGGVNGSDVQPDTGLSTVPADSTPEVSGLDVETSAFAGSYEERASEQPPSASPSPSGDARSPDPVTGTFSSNDPFRNSPAGGALGAKKGAAATSATATGRAAGAAPASPPPPPPPPAVAGPMKDDAPPATPAVVAAMPVEPPLDVHATSAAVIIPVTGATLRLQHLLLPPDDPATILFSVRPNRRSQ